MRGNFERIVHDDRCVPRRALVNVVYVEKATVPIRSNFPS